MSRGIPRFVFAIALFTMLFACEDDPCEGVDCSGHGTCLYTKDRTPYCDCDPGYWPDGLQCVMDSNNVEKPLIYLYPGEVLEVEVRFPQAFSEFLTHTYPAYEDGWRVVAHPDGTLVDPATGGRYYGLYWEAELPVGPRPVEGFVVPGADTAAFLEEALARLGLNWREAGEFIIYWLPVLEWAPYNFIHFATTAWEAAAPLEVTPPPDTRIRFLMRYEPLDVAPSSLPPPQTLTAPPRVGFTLVEWGGARLEEAR